ncbi:MAG TPA: hypothetical protein VFQ61_31080 [Polyangiaceae bacterium]|nr:hypothetical protein [Polyangiaceae bacterium]
MTLTDLGILYGLSGVMSAIWLRRRPVVGVRPSLGSTLLVVLVWPLWVPVVLSAERPNPVVTQRTSLEMESALVEGHQAIQGTPLEPLLPRAALERMQTEVRRAAERLAELDTLLSSPAFDRTQALEHLERLERRGASGRTLASARSHCESIERLAALRDRDRAILEEVSELSRALRTQLVLSRYRGSSPSDAGDIVSELWARLEVLDIDSAPLARPPDNDAREANPGRG